MEDIRRSPAEVRGLSHYLHGFSTIPGANRISSIKSISVFQKNQGSKALKWAACSFYPHGRVTIFLCAKPPPPPNINCVHQENESCSTPRSSPLIFESRVQPLCSNLRMNSPRNRAKGIFSTPTAPDSHEIYKAISFLKTYPTYLCRT